MDGVDGVYLAITELMTYDSICLHRHGLLVTRLAASLFELCLRPLEPEKLAPSRSRSQIRPRRRQAIAHSCLVGLNDGTCPRRLTGDALLRHKATARRASEPGTL